MYKSVLGAALATLAFSTPAAAATEIFNETFENAGAPATGTGFGFFNSVGPWTASDTNKTGVELQWGNRAGDTATVAKDGVDGGRVLVELDSNRNNSMFYILQESGEFVLDFLYSPRPNITAASNIVIVSIDGAFAKSTPFTGPLVGTNSNTDWRSESFTFKGNAGDKLLIAAGGTSDSLGGYIDNTVLSKIGPVPEPATWLLMILGLGAVGASMRQRQKATARIQFS